LVTLILTLVLFYYYFITSESSYDLGFVEDDDIDLVETSDHAHRAMRYAKKVLEREREQNLQMPPPMSQSPDGLTRVGNWNGRHPLLEIISKAEMEWKSEMELRPWTVSILVACEGFNLTPTSLQMLTKSIEGSTEGLLPRHTRVSSAYYQLDAQCLQSPL
jgi:hypothetical protein